MEQVVCVTNKGSRAYLKIESIINETEEELPGKFRNAFPVALIQDAIVVIDRCGVVFKNRTGMDDLNTDEHFDIIHEIPYLCLVSIINTGKSGMREHEVIENMILIGKL